MSVGKEERQRSDRLFAWNGAVCAKGRMVSGLANFSRTRPYLLRLTRVRGVCASRTPDTRLLRPPQCCPCHLQPHPSKGMDHRGCCGCGGPAKYLLNGAVWGCAHRTPACTASHPGLGPVSPGRFLNVDIVTVGGTHHNRLPVAPLFFITSCFNHSSGRLRLLALPSHLDRSHPPAIRASVSVRVRASLLPREFIAPNPKRRRPKRFCRSSPAPASQTPHHSIDKDPDRTDRSKRHPPALDDHSVPSFGTPSAPNFRPS